MVTPSLGILSGNQSPKQHQETRRCTEFAHGFTLAAVYPLCCSSSSQRTVPILILTILAALFISWLIWHPRLVSRRRKRLLAHRFPPAWRAIIRRNVPLAARLPADLQFQLRRHIQVFVAEKAFIGCQGQVIDDEVRVTIAAQACLLLLNRPNSYFPTLRQVLVYPRSFMVTVQHMDEIGVMQSGRDWRAGESWQEGLVILSWEDVLEGAAAPHDGWNVVIHEFAHQLDAESGLTHGSPALPTRERRARWSRVMQAEFDSLCAALRKGDENTFLDPYGASEPVEFFAVATEAFFEQGARLMTHHPDLYQELRSLYQVDTSSWEPTQASHGFDRG